MSGGWQGHEKQAIVAHPVRYQLSQHPTTGTEWHAINRGQDSGCLNGIRSACFQTRVRSTTAELSRSVNCFERVTEWAEIRKHVSTKPLRETFETRQFWASVFVDNAQVTSLCVSLYGVPNFRASLYGAQSFPLIGASRTMAAKNTTLSPETHYHSQEN